MAIVETFAVSFHWVFVFLSPRHSALASAFARDPSPGPQFVFTSPVPQFLLNSPGLQFLFIDSGPKFIFMSPGTKFLFT